MTAGADSGSPRPRGRPVAVGDIRRLHIERLADGPDGLARIDGYVVFVPGALPGEDVRAEITSAKAKLARAALRGVERPAATRVAPECRHFDECGGCDWQHCAYDAQLQLKTARVRSALQHALGAAAAEVVAPMVGPLQPYEQRTKVALQLEVHGGRLRAGLRQRRSMQLVPLHECPVSQASAFALARAAATALRRGVPEAEQSALRAVVVRAAAGTGEHAVLLVAGRQHVTGVDAVAGELADAGATTVAVNLNPGPRARLLGPRTHVVHGPPRITERIDGLTYQCSPAAFFQTSAFGAEWLVQNVPALLRAGADDRALDLYCGGGLLSLALARTCRAVTGVERNAAAVGDARASAAASGLHNAKFTCGAAAQVARRLLDRRGPRTQIAVLDPPRAGCDAELLDLIGKSDLQRLAYVSCDPSALARDADALTERGFALQHVQPLDMFPHTHHVECVAVMQRRR